MRGNRARGGWVRSCRLSSSEFLVVSESHALHNKLKIGPNGFLKSCINPSGAASVFAAGSFAPDCIAVMANVHAQVNRACELCVSVAGLHITVGLPPTSWRTRLWSIVGREARVWSLPSPLRLTSTEETCLTQAAEHPDDCNAPA